MGTKTPNRLRACREKRRMTLQQLAVLVGSTKTHLSLIERGRVIPRGITQERISSALGIDRDELFPEQEEAAV